MDNSSIIYYEPPLEKMVESFKQPNFFNGRFNDGELIGISQRNNFLSFGENSDRHKYFPKMGNEMRDVMIRYKYSDTYLISSTITWYASAVERGVIDEIFSKNPDLRLHSGYFFYDILRKPELNYFIDFIEFLNQKKVVIIGGSYNTNNKLFKNFDVIEVPLINAYNVMNDVNKKIEEFNQSGEDINYVFMCGMMAGIIIDSFHQTDKKNSYYDVGSAFDFFYQSEKFNGVFIPRRMNINLRDTLNKYYKNFIV
jgi:hypothetical protein